MAMNTETAAALEGLTIRFAELVHALKYEAIPEEVTKKAKFIIRDGLGNQIAASAISDPARKVIEMVKEWGGKPESTVTGTRAMVPSAARVGAAPLATGAQAKRALPSTSS